MVCLLLAGGLFWGRAASGRTEKSSDGSLSGREAADYLKRSGLIRELALQSPFAFQAYLKASNTDAGDYFGYSVAISGNTVAIGAPRESSGATGINGNAADNSAALAGAVYVFVREGIFWKLQAYIKASNAEAGDQFGYSLALSGETLVVGAPNEDSGATGVNGDQGDNSINASGAAYVFVRQGTVWSQQAYLKAINPDPLDQFGFSVAISGDTVAVGAIDEDSGATGVNGSPFDNSARASGAAYVFFRSGGLWSQQAYLKASNTGIDDQFGYSVGVSGDTAVIGARLEDSNATGINGDGSNNLAINSGAAYVFTRTGAAWSQQAYLKPSNTGTGDQFGVSAVIDGDRIVVGAPNEDSPSVADPNSNSLLDSGAVYVFTRSAGAWSQQALIKAPNAETQDLFGRSLSLSGTMLLVTAPNEDSAAGLVNGNMSDNSAPNSGAAYVFANSGTNWAFQTYLKASNPETGDLFGISSAISGDTVIIGAYQEDSNATGSNGNEFDNSAESSGSAYVYAPGNTPPKVSPVAVGRIAGAPVLNTQIATVDDAEDDETRLTPRINGSTTATTNGVTVSGLSITASGSLTADIVAAPNAATANFALRVTDTEGLFTEITLTVNVIVAAVTLENPFECLGQGSQVTLTARISNTGAPTVRAGLASALPAGLSALQGSCVAATGICAVQNPVTVVWSGDIGPGQTTIISFKAQVSDMAQKGLQLCINTGLTAAGGAAGTVQNCAAVNCEPPGQGVPMPAAAFASGQKAGSLLIYNYFSSSIDGRQQNTRLNITNAAPDRSVYVQFFIVDGNNGISTGFSLRLSPAQTFTFLASDLDPGTTGYLIAVAVDPAGCPVNHNFLIGDEYVRSSSGMQANLHAIAVSALTGFVPVCYPGSTSVTLSFDGQSYGELPQVLALDNLPAPADGNETLMVLNRIGGDLGATAATLEPLTGIVFDDLESGVSFTLTNRIPQLASTLSNNLPRTAPRYDRIIQAGRSGWMKIWQSIPGGAMTGSMINYNRNSQVISAAFSQGHNLHVLTITNGASLTIPLMPFNQG